MEYLPHLVVAIAFVLFVWYVVKESRSSRRNPPSRPGPLERSSNQRSPLSSATTPKTTGSGAAGWLCSPEEVFTKEHVSFTRLKLFDQCPRRFELVYLMGTADPVGKPAEVGSVVHRLLELYTGANSGSASKGLRIKAGAAETILENYDSAIAAVQPRHSISRHELLPYCRSFVDLNKGTVQVFAWEHHCEGSIGSRKLKCIVDRIDTDGEGGWTIVDYKTGNPRYAVNEQLNVYGHALHDGQSRTMKLQYQFLKTGETRSWTFTPSVQRATADWLQRRVERIESARIFPQKRTPLCHYCGVSHFC